MSLVIYVAAFVCYGLLSNPWLAIIPEVMQYIAFGLSMPACIVYFKERSSDEYSATVQGELRREKSERNQRAVTRITDIVARFDVVKI